MVSLRPVPAVLLALALAAALAIPASSNMSAARNKLPVCRPGRSVEMTGSMSSDLQDSYRLVPFRVARGVNKLVITYSYTGDGVLDLGVWDNDGALSYRGFRGWSGSRQGRVEAGQPKVVIQTDRASRNFLPGKIRRGRWTVELGGGEIGTEGTDYLVKVKCRNVSVAKPPSPDIVDADHIADPSPGWYFGDFHMHAFHSNLNGPTNDEFVAYARTAGLDFMPITEYQINRHWKEWGSTAADNPDLIFWPGREVITYFGHAAIIGETPGLIEYRHGFKGITMSDIQAGAIERGALFQINHPASFPPPADFLCRGCFWELDDDIDPALVDTIEVVNTEVTGGFGSGSFVDAAIEFWEDKLLDGYAIAPVGGSDDKLGPKYGKPAVAVYAEELSRPALIEAIRGGHVYIAARGVEDSPTLSFTATDGERTAMFGDTLAVGEADFTVEIDGGLDHTLWIYRDGEVVDEVAIDSDDFTYTFVGTAAPTSSPLGSYYRVETRSGGSPGVKGLLSTLGMPIFLDGP